MALSEYGKKIVKTIKDIEKNADDTLWISGTETVCDRLLSLLLQFEDVEIIKNIFPDQV